MLLRVFGNFFAQSGGVGFEKIGVYDRFFLSFKKGVLAAVGVVDQVVGQDECAVFKAVVDADDGGNGDDVFRTYGMQRPDVGAVVDFMWCDGMAEAVPRKEENVLTAQFAA